MEVLLNCLHSVRRSRLPLAKAWGLLVAVLALALPAAPASAYLYQQALMAVDRPVSNLRCSDVTLPKALRIEWEYHPYGTPTYEVARVTGGTTTVLGTTTNKYWVDTFAFTFGTTYQYKVRVMIDYSPSMGLPPPPQGANPADIYYMGSATGNPWVTISVTPGQVTASEVQTADSRLDLRYGNPTFQDFLFGSRTYRGGLYAGYSADPSRVGRSLIKFPLPSMAVGQNMWVANVHAYYTRSFANGSTTVGCQVVTDPWTAATLKWSNQPVLAPGAATKTETVTYTGTASERWCHWTITDKICGEWFGDGTVSFALAATNETTAGWAYFAKSGYNPALAPVMLFAYGAPLLEMDLTLTPSTVGGGGSSTGRVTLNGKAPTGGIVVTLSDDSASATTPSTVTIPAGAGGANFTVTTTAVTQTTAVTVSAVYNGVTKTAILTINP